MVQSMLYTEIQSRWKGMQQVKEPKVCGATKHNVTETSFYFLLQLGIGKAAGQKSAGDMNWIGLTSEAIQIIWFGFYF